MTSQPHGGAPNAFVAEHATLRDALPLDQVTLMGVAGPDDAMHGFLRLPEGEILRIELNTPMAFGTPIEIGTTGVVIALANGNAAFLPPYPFGLDAPPA